MTGQITKDDFARMIAGAVASIRAQHAMLSELDCATGDGDHGTTMLRTVDRLEKARLVRRMPSEDDRRGAYAEITAEGRKLRRKMWPVYAAAIDELFGAHLTQAEADTVGRALQKVLTAARGDHIDGQSSRRSSVSSAS